jgi:mannose-6-phosphate isomerase-like protein (cupin superfamily)
MTPLFIVAVLAAGPQAAPAAQPRRAPSVATLEIAVTDRSGAPLKGARVSVEGNSERDGLTNGLGRLTMINVRAGRYMLHIEHEQYIALEKEFIVRAGVPSTVTAALSLAPPPAPRVVQGPVGNPRVISIPDFAERQLIGKEAVKESSISCSGAAEARLIQMRDPVAAHTHRDADEMLYVVAGDATLKIGDVEQRISPGWFSMVPRGTPHSLARKGRTPVILLSMLSGQPCPIVVANAGH